eukprot:1019064-Prymnesium_polylepis.1
MGRNHYYCGLGSDGLSLEEAWLGLSVIQLYSGPCELVGPRPPRRPDLTIHDSTVPGQPYARQWRGDRTAHISASAQR